MGLKDGRKDAAQHFNRANQGSRLLGVALFVGALTAVSLAQGADLERIQGPLALSTLRSHSRLALKLETRPTLEFQDRADGFELLIKGFGLADLGAPFGEEKRFAERFLRASDDRLKSVTFKEEDNGNLRVNGEWRFATGPQAPAVRKMEVFQYTDRETGKWILDFWQKPGPTVAEVKAASERAARIAALKAAEEVRARKVSRQLASDRDVDKPELRLIVSNQDPCRHPLRALN